MSKKFVRIIFILTFPALIVQYAFFRIKKTQPYPAIIMPDFANAPKKLADPTIREWRLNVRYADGAEEALTIHDLFYDAPPFYRVNMMRVAFAKHSRIRPGHEAEFKTWLRRRLEKITGRSDLAAIQARSIKTKRDAKNAGDENFEELLYEVEIAL